MSDNETNVTYPAVRGLVLTAILGIALAAPAAQAGGNGGWNTAHKLLRVDGTQVPGGCPIESPAGLFVFTARNPSGSNIDIYVNQRSHPTAPMEPGNILSPEISDPGANDFCPTPLPDGQLYFVSNRDAPGVCGDSGDTDMFRSVDNPATGYSEPQVLGCAPQGPNTSGTEFAPAVISNRWGTFLFYSSDGPTGNQDIYMSYQRADGTFGPGYRLPWPINTEYDDRQPNVSQDGREIVFTSNRPSPGETMESATFDIFYAKRRVVFWPWNRVSNLSESVPFETVDADETRPSLSWDGKRLLYGAGGVWESRRDHN